MGVLKIGKIVFLSGLFFISVNIFGQVLSNDSISKSSENYWRVLSDSGKYQEAISLLKLQLESCSKKEKHAVRWHIGQLYAYDNNYEMAIYFLKKSTPIMIIDREWRLYYKGTIAFLERDETKLKKLSERLWTRHTAYNQNNAITLKTLEKYFNLNYYQAYNSKLSH